MDIKKQYLRVKTYLANKPNLRKTIGISLIVIGFISLVTPFTPGSWLIFVGLEIMGIRLVLWDRLKAWFKKILNKNSGKRNF